MVFAKLMRAVLPAALLTLAASPDPVAAQQRFVTIGTGGVTGVYYPTGGAICRLLNRNRAEHGIRCSVESTGGSIYNLNAMRGGDLNLSIVQSDWQYYAYQGGSEFKGQGAYRDLRAVFSLHPEPFTVLARKDAGVERFEDLEGKRVNIGDPGSGQRGTMELLMQRYGWTRGDFALASELKASEQAQALCDNKIDVMIYAVGHPSGAIQEATTACDSVLVEVTGEVVDDLIAENPYYRRVTIPGGLYRGNPDDTQTFGVGATLVADASVPEDVIYEVTRSVFENFSTFQRLHPAFKVLDKKEMVSASLSAPLHPGAERYYREQGLLK